jgi:hypothetical protein
MTSTSSTTIYEFLYAVMDVSSADLQIDLTKFNAFITRHGPNAFITVNDTGNDGCMLEGQVSLINVMMAPACAACNVQLAFDLLIAKGAKLGNMLDKALIHGSKTIDPTVMFLGNVVTNPALSIVLTGHPAFDPNQLIVVPDGRQISLALLIAPYVQQAVIEQLVKHPLYDPLRQQAIFADGTPVRGTAYEHAIMKPRCQGFVDALLQLGLKSFATL